MTYAVLGEQELDVVGYWSALTASEKLSLAEQKMIEGKPALQYVGAELDTLKIEVNWHIAYCDPQAELDQMREVMASKQAYPLVMGNGLFRGRYVVRGIDIQVQRTDDMGTLHQIQASLDLVEYAAPPQPVAVANPPAVASSRHPAAQKPAAGPAPARTETVTNADGYSSTRIVRGPGMLGGGV